MILYDLLTQKKCHFFFNYLLGVPIEFQVQNHILAADVDLNGQIMHVIVLVARGFVLQRTAKKWRVVHTVILFGKCAKKSARKENSSAKSVYFIISLCELAAGLQCGECFLACGYGRWWKCSAAEPTVQCHVLQRLHADNLPFSTFFRVSNDRIGFSLLSNAKNFNWH